MGIFKISSRSPQTAKQGIRFKSTNCNQSPQFGGEIEGNRELDGNRTLLNGSPRQLVSPQFPDQARKDELIVSGDVHSAPNFKYSNLGCINLKEKFSESLNDREEGKLGENHIPFGETIYRPKLSSRVCGANIKAR
ncbi:hypothetical protein U1Q18_006816 [Sarracenia purpurea var. burkii]